MLKVPPAINTIPSGQLFFVGDAFTSVEEPKKRHIVSKLRINDFNQKVFIKFLCLNNTSSQLNWL
jgi:hypothetical protein